MELEDPDEEDGVDHIMGGQLPDVGSASSQPKGVNFQNLEYGQLTHHLQSDQNYKKNFQENMSKSLN